MTLQTFLLGLALALLAAGMVCWIWGFILMLRAARHRNPDAPFRWLVYFGSHNAGWFADQLDEDGLRYRRLALKFQFTAAGFWVAFILMGIGLSRIR